MREKGEYEPEDEQSKYAGLDIEDIKDVIKNGAGVKWNGGNILKLTGSEYAAVKSRISTDYYRKANHDGIQCIDRSTDGKNANHYLYLYVDHGFDSYEIICRLEYARQMDVITFLREAIQNGRKAKGVSAGTHRLRDFYEHADRGSNDH